MSIADYGIAGLAIILFWMLIRNELRHLRYEIYKMRKEISRLCFNLETLFTSLFKKKIGK